MTDIPDHRPYAVVTVTDLALELRTVRDLLTNLTARVDAVITAHAADIADHEARIRALERTTWSRAGLASLVAAVLTVLASTLLKGH